MSRSHLQPPQQPQQPQGGLILSLEVGPCNLAAALLDSTQRLRPVATHKVPLPIHQDFPTTVTDVLGALDDLLDWVRGINARGLPPDPSSRSQSHQTAAYRRIEAIAIASQPNHNVLITPAAAMIIAMLSPVSDLQSQATFPAFFSFPTTLRNLPPGIDADLEYVEEEIAIRQGQDLVDAFNRAHHSQANLYQFYDAQCPAAAQSCRLDLVQPERVSRNQLRQNIAKRTAPLAVDSPVVQLFRLMSAHRRAAWSPLEQQCFDALSETARVLEMGTLIASFFTGTLLGPDPIESIMTGAYNLEASFWDDVLIDVLATHNRTNFNPETGFGRPRPDSGIVGTVSPWLVERHHFWPSCRVMTCLPSAVASYASFLPHHGDVGIKLGQDDHMVIPSWLPVPDTEGVTVPNPVASILERGHDQHRGDHRTVSTGTEVADGLTQDTTPRYLTLARATSAGEARKTVQKMYTNGSWAVFERLMGAVCVGGSIGMDNKFYSIFHPFGKNAGIKRYELGICVAEFSDLRANARCLIEGQAMAMRALMSRMATRDSVACAQAQKSSDDSFQPPPGKPRKLDFATNASGGVGLALRFDPFDDSLAPRRILVTGAAASNRSIVQCFTQVLGATAVVSAARHTQPQQPPTRPQQTAQYHFGVHTPSRALLGAGYIAFALWTLDEHARVEGRLPERLSEGGPLLNFNSIVANTLAGGTPLSPSTPRATAPPPTPASPDSAMPPRSPNRSWSPQCETILEQICRRMKAEAGIATAGDSGSAGAGAGTSGLGRMGPSPGRARSSSSPGPLSFGSVGVSTGGSHQPQLPSWFEDESGTPSPFSPFASEGDPFPSLSHSPVTGTSAGANVTTAAPWGSGEDATPSARTGSARRYAPPGAGAGSGSTPRHSHSPTRSQTLPWTRHGSFLNLDRGLGRLDEGAEEEDSAGSASASASASAFPAFFQGGVEADSHDVRGGGGGPEEWERTPRARVLPLPQAQAQPEGEQAAATADEEEGLAWRSASTGSNPAQPSRRRRRPHSMLGAVPGSGPDAAAASPSAGGVLQALITRDDAIPTGLVAASVPAGASSPSAASSNSSSASAFSSASAACSPPDAPSSSSGSETDLIAKRVGGVLGVAPYHTTCLSASTSASATSHRCRLSPEAAPTRGCDRDGKTPEEASGAGRERQRGREDSAPASGNASGGTRASVGASRSPTNRVQGAGKPKSSGERNEAPLPAPGQGRAWDSAPPTGDTNVQAQVHAPTQTQTQTQASALREREREKQLREWLQGRSAAPPPPSSSPSPTPASAATATAPPAPAPRPTPAEEARSAAEREQVLERAQLREEELLGLERVARWDEDVWAVYGALVEEHVRLCGWGLALGRGVGEQ